MNRIIENIVKNVLHLTTIVFILLIAIQPNKEGKIEISEESKNTQEIVKTEQTAKNTKKRINENIQTTSRSSAIRIRENKNVEEIVQEPEIQYTKIEDVTISRDMDLTVRTGLSKEDFKRLISNVKQIS